MQTSFLSSLEFSLLVSLPNILMLSVGVGLKKKRIIDDKFCEQASKLVFNITLPLLLFLGISQHPIDYSAQAKTISIGILVTLLLFVGSEISAHFHIANKKERGIFVQAVFRGNLGIMGLALCANAYGVAGLAVAAVYVALITLLYNILAVLTLTRSLADNGAMPIGMLAKQISKNPLIIAIVIALISNKMQFSPPQVLLTSAHYLANITLPLALICTGASLKLTGLDNSSALAIRASIGRIVIAPLIMVFVAKLCGLQGMNLGIVFLLSATPTAAASYIMVKAMGGNATMVANIIGLTTLGSLFSSTLGLLILKQLQWI